MWGIFRATEAAVVAGATCAALVGCGAFATDREPAPKPPPTLVSGSGSTVTVGDDQSGSPVELRADQRLTVRLRLAGSTRSDWVLADFQPGVLTEVGGTRFEQDATAAVYGEIAGTQSWRFAAAKPGQTLLRFELRVPRSREPPTAVATFAVTVR